jgi:GxxExxY protein
MLLYEEQTFQIIGACMEVHKKLGNGFLESVYEEALEMEFIKRNILYLRQHKLNLFYDGLPMDKFFKADFLCYQSVILEIKAVSFLNKDMQKQTINYLHASNMQVGLLINFGESSLKWKRFINTPKQSMSV